MCYIYLHSTLDAPFVVNQWNARQCQNWRQLDDPVTTTLHTCAYNHIHTHIHTQTHTYVFMPEMAYFICVCLCLCRAVY